MKTRIIATLVASVLGGSLLLWQAPVSAEEPTDMPKQGNEAKKPAKEKSAKKAAKKAHKKAEDDDKQKGEEDTE